jgi:hypothetical protein
LKFLRSITARSIRARTHAGRLEQLEAAVAEFLMDREKPRALRGLALYDQDLQKLAIRGPGPPIF